MSQPSGDPTLHPVLQAALRSLDVQLEAELTQYRCHRAVRSSSPLVHQVDQAQLNKTPATSPGNLAITPKLSKDTELVFAPSDQNADLATSDLEDASLLELTRSRLLTERPEGYLASSEALLKNLQEMKIPREFSPVKVLLTAWGITLIVVLLSSIAVGYLLIHLAGPNRLKFAAQASKSPTSSPAYPVPELKVKDTEVRSPAAMSTPKPAISPDLSVEEFVQLDLPNLSRLKSSPEPALQTTPKPKATKAPGSANTGQVTAEQSTPKAIPTPPGQGRSPQAPQSQKPPRSATPTTATPLRKDRYYYVLMNYASGKSLQQAQKVVKDAHVRKFPEGRRVQIGAFDDNQSAQKLVHELKRQGVPAAVRKPAPSVREP